MNKEYLKKFIEANESLINQKRFKECILKLPSFSDKAAFINLLSSSGEILDSRINLKLSQMVEAAYGIAEEMEKDFISVKDIPSVDDVLRNSDYLGPETAKEVAKVAIFMGVPVMKYSGGDEDLYIFSSSFLDAKSYINMYSHEPIDVTQIKPILTISQV